MERYLTNANLQSVSQPRRPVDGGVAAVVAETAGAVFQIAEQRRAENDALKMAQAGASAADQITELTLEAEQATDPTDMIESFEQRASEIEAQTVETLPPHKREEFQLSFQNTLRQARGQVVRREALLRTSAGREALSETMDRFAVTLSKATTPEQRSVILEQAARAQDDAFALGFVTEAEANGALSSLIEAGEEGAAIRLKGEDPAAFLAAEKNGDFDAIDPAQLARLVADAKGRVAQEQRRRALEAEQAQRAADAALRTEVRGAVEIISAGLVYEGLPELQEAVEGTEYAPVLNAAVANQAEFSAFALMSPIQQRERLGELRAEATEDPGRIDLIRALEQSHVRTVSGMQEDPLGFAAQQGALVLAPVDLASEDSIRERMAVAEGFSAFSGRLRFLTDQEASALEVELDHGSIDQQLQILNAIVEGFDDRAAIVLSEVSEDHPDLLYAGQLMIETGSTVSARAMLQGRQLLADGNGAKPSSATRSIVASEMRAAFPETSSLRMASMLSAADAHFAATGFGASDEQEAYRASVQAVMGGKTVAGQTYGGIQPVNSRPTALPPRVQARDVEQALRRATADDLLAASFTGNPPLRGTGPAIAPDRRGRETLPSDVTLMSVGGGHYLVGVRGQDGSTSYLTDAASVDGFYRLNLQRLLDRNTIAPTEEPTGVGRINALIGRGLRGGE